jgi:hypothetical protein
MVIRRSLGLEKDGAGDRDRQSTEPEDVAVEGCGALGVPDVENSVVEAVNRHRISNFGIVDNTVNMLEGSNIPELVFMSCRPN